MEIFKLEDKHIKIKDALWDYFKDLQFNEESHTYTLESNKNQKFKSVSGFIKKYVFPFDADKISEFVAKKQGVSKEFILQQWEDNKNRACELGTKVHLFGELYNPEISVPSNGFEEAIVKFFKSIPPHIKLITNELRMYNSNFNIAGTADLIFYNTLTGKLIIGDFKTNVDLFKNYKGQKMITPFHNMLDHSFNKYQLQLSYYQLLLEQTGYEVENRKIIWLKPDGNFKVYNTENLTKTLIKELIDESTRNNTKNTISL